MRLRRLEIQGFKSFPTRSVIEFAPGVTGIVGPNGCGKSNLVDAIRWVLGEQSAKQLRGGSMEDVLFKGSETYPAANLAEVCLTFENLSDSWIEAPPDADPLVALARGSLEFTVSRRYYRTGESEYLINRQPCRLKDVLELIAGTGAGLSSYAIIEQGRVEKLVLAKPEERRLFIEDAAGTALYRSRRMAAQRRMERTRENLARVNDISRELERQVSYWRRLVKRGEQARALREQICALDLTIAWRQLNDFKTEQEGLRVQALALDEKLSALFEEIEQNARALSERLVQVTRANEAIGELERQRERCAAELAALQREREFVLSQMQEAERRKQALRLEAKQVETERAAAAINSVRDLEGRESIWRGLLEAERLLKRRRFEEQCLRWRVERLRHEQQGVLVDRERLWRAEVETRNRLQRNEREFGLLQERCNELARAADRNASALRQLERMLVGEASRLHELREDASRAEQDAQRGQALLSARGIVLAEAERQLQALRSELLETQSRLKVLDDLRRAYDGYPRSVKSLLEDESFRQGEGVLGTVADILDVPAEWERAVAAALGPYLHCLIVGSEERSLEAIRALRERSLGRGQFIARRPRVLTSACDRVAGLNGASRPLLQLVNVETGFEELAKALLGPVAVAPTIREGLRLWEEAGGDITVVTPEGDAVDRQGVVTGGYEGGAREHELLARRRLVGELSEALSKTRTRVSEAERHVRQLRQEWDHVKEAHEVARARTRELRSLIEQTQEQLRRGWVERARLVEELEEKRRELCRHTQEMERLGRLLCEDRMALDQLVRDRTEFEERAFGAEDLRRAEAALVAAREGVAQAQVRLAVLRQQHEAAVQSLVAAEYKSAHLAQRRQNVDAEQAAQDRLLGEHKQRLAAVRSREEQLRADVERFTLRLQEVRRSASQLDQDVRCLEEKRATLERERDKGREERAQVDVRLAELSVRMSHLVEDTVRKHGLPEEAWAEYAAQQGETGTDELRQRVAELERSLERLGDVGSATLSELESLESRLEFLRHQKTDLERSLHDLERTIQRLDETSRDRFAKTLAQVSESFRQIVPRLLGGADAELVLCEEQDGVGAGVEILVRPPGKRLESVSLLSGGEKALVAIALLFAMFEANPAPFCVLDEVDAPLDDANVARFSDLIRVISQRAQVLVVTHNKRTMFAADRLYGVTMQTPGISTVLSINLSGAAPS